MKNRKIVSVIPKRETCDTCINGIAQSHHDPLKCLKHLKSVSWKGWCEDYQGLATTKIEGVNE